MTLWTYTNLTDMTHQGGGRSERVREPRSDGWDVRLNREEFGYWRRFIGLDHP